MNINVENNYAFTFTRNYALVDSTGWTQFCFTVKKNATDLDSAAIVFVKLTSPPSGTDGLVLLNGGSPISPTTAADGSITVNNAPFNTNLTVFLSGRGTNLNPGAY